MHVSNAGRNAVARIEVVAHSTAHYESKCEVLSLTNPRLMMSLFFRLLGVSESEAAA